MEKITKEELLEKLGRIPLSDDELEKIAGGDTNQCLNANNCHGIEEWALKKACIMHCLNQ